MHRKKKISFTDELTFVRKSRNRVKLIIISVKKKMYIFLGIKIKGRVILG